VSRALLGGDEIKDRDAFAQRERLARRVPQRPGWPRAGGRDAKALEDARDRGGVPRRPRCARQHRRRRVALPTLIVYGTPNSRSGGSADRPRRDRLVAGLSETGGGLRPRVNSSNRARRASKAVGVPNGQKVGVDGQEGRGGTLPRSQRARQANTRGISCMMVEMRPGHAIRQLVS